MKHRLLLLFLIPQHVYSMFGGMVPGEPMWRMVERVGQSADLITLDMQRMHSLVDYFQENMHQRFDWVDEIEANLNKIQLQTWSLVDQLHIEQQTLQRQPIMLASLIDDTQARVDRVHASTIDMLDGVAQQHTSDKILDGVDAQQSTSDEIVRRIAEVKKIVAALSCLDTIESSDTRLLLSKVNDIEKNIKTISYGATEGITIELSPEYTDTIHIAFQYGFDAADVQQKTSGDGTVSYENNMVMLEAGGILTTGSARVTSNKKTDAQAGHDAYAMFSAAFVNAALNSTQLIGVYDDRDGVAIGVINGVFVIRLRRFGVDTIISQSSFNKDRLDGSGPSFFSIKLHTLNAYKIVYGCTGASPISLYVLNEAGQWVCFHTIERGNSFNTPTFSNNCLPMRADVSRGLAILQPGVGLYTTAWRAGIIGAVSRAANRYFQESNLVDNVNAQEKVLLSLRNATSINGVNNNVPIRVGFIGGANLDKGNEYVLVKVYKNGTIKGGSFQSKAHSVMEINKTATSISNNDEEVFSFGLVSNGMNQMMTFMPEGPYDIVLLPGESITFVGTSLSGDVDSVLVNIGWKELY